MIHTVFLIYCFSLSEVQHKPSDSPEDKDCLQVRAPGFTVDHFIRWVQIHCLSEARTIPGGTLVLMPRLLPSSACLLLCLGLPAISPSILVFSSSHHLWLILEWWTCIASLQIARTVGRTWVYLLGGLEQVNFSWRAREKRSKLTQSEESFSCSSWRS